jgi:hypothetical protein
LQMTMRQATPPPVPAQVAILPQGVASPHGAKNPPPEAHVIGNG